MRASATHVFAQHRGASQSLFRLRTLDAWHDGPSAEPRAVSILGSRRRCVGAPPLACVQSAKTRPSHLCAPFGHYHWPHAPSHTLGRAIATGGKISHRDKIACLAHRGSPCQQAATQKALPPQQTAVIDGQPGFARSGPLRLLRHERNRLSPAAVPASAETLTWTPNSRHQRALIYFSKTALAVLGPPPQRTRAHAPKAIPNRPRSHDAVRSDN